MKVTTVGIDLAKTVFQIHGVDEHGKTFGNYSAMRAGDLKCLAGGVPHSLVAIEDSSVLVTLLLHGA